MDDVRLSRLSASQRPVLENLFELYAHDFSEIVPLSLNERGRFDVALRARWFEDGGHTYLIHADEELAGFAIAERGSRIDDDPDVFDVAELFVVRGLRRHGVGLAAARALLSVWAGRWEIRVRANHTLALTFWQKVTHAQSERVSASDPTWRVFRLNP